MLVYRAHLKLCLPALRLSGPAGNVGGPSFSLTGGFHVKSLRSPFLVVWIDARSLAAGALMCRKFPGRLHHLRLSP